MEIYHTAYPLYRGPAYSLTDMMGHADGVCDVLVRRAHDCGWQSGPVPFHI